VISSASLKLGQFICEYSGKVLSRQKTKELFPSPGADSLSRGAARGSNRVNYIMVLREHFSQPIAKENG